MSEDEGSGAGDKHQPGGQGGQHWKERRQQTDELAAISKQSNKGITGHLKGCHPEFVLDSAK